MGGQGAPQTLCLSVISCYLLGSVLSLHKLARIARNKKRHDVCVFIYCTSRYLPRNCCMLGAKAPPPHSFSTQCSANTRAMSRQLGGGANREPGTSTKPDRLPGRGACCVHPGGRGKRLPFKEVRGALPACTSASAVPAAFSAPIPLGLLLLLLLLLFYFVIWVGGSAQGSQKGVPDLLELE